MAVSINQVNSASGGDTFQVWVEQTNKTINAISTVVVSVNTHANGGLTTGNGFVEGIFGARTGVANTFRGGTVETPALLTISSNVEVSGDTIILGDVLINSSGIAVDGVPITTGGYTFETNTSGTTAQEVDNFDKLTLRGAEYVVTIKDNGANAYQINKLVLVHDSGNAYMTDYAVVFSNSALGNYSANANGTHIRVYLTPVPSNTHVTGSRVTLGI